MNKLTTSIAVATIAIASTGVAEAKIVLGGEQVPTGGEYILAMANLTKQNSYVLDTGKFIIGTDLTTALPVSGSSASDAALASFLATYEAGDDVIWGFGSSYKKFTEVEDAPFVGYYGTKETATPLNNGAQGWDQAGSAWDNIGGENQTDVLDNAVNASSFKVVGEIGYVGAYGKDGFGNAAYNIFGDLGSSISLVDEGIIFDLNTGNTTRDYKVLGLANLSLSANGFGFQYTPAGGPVDPAPVPLPAAVWLFGAGLMGVLRRRKALAA